MSQGKMLRELTELIRLGFYELKSESAQLIGHVYRSKMSGERMADMVRLGDFVGLIGGILLAGVIVLKEPAGVFAPIFWKILSVVDRMLGFVESMATWPYRTLRGYVASKLTWKVIFYLNRHGHSWMGSAVAVVGTKLFGLDMYVHELEKRVLRHGTYVIRIRESDLKFNFASSYRPYTSSHAWAVKKEDGTYSIMIQVENRLSRFDMDF